MKQIKDLEHKEMTFAMENFQKHVGRKYLVVKTEDISNLL